ncbi:MAG TPA: fumarylacetoacetate hydrolase family protein [Burkholderiales bacterium]|nr:fumarylacetoacetate hydrolase family protein [Burkholderiales bacterium]
MKLLRYSRKRERAALARLGVLVGKDTVADLRAGYALYLAEEKGNPKGEQLASIYMPAYITQFLHMGEPAWEALGEAYVWLSDIARSDPDALGLSDEALFIPLAECRLYVPVRPSKLISVARNYPEYTKHPGRQAGEVPTAFIKTASALVGPGRDVIKPAATRELDCETELAVVIGKKCKHVAEADAYDVVAGYTIVNDLSARDVARKERSGGHLLLGKTFDTFAPMGPWMVTRDEIPDPMYLRVITRVNGEVRQDGNTSSMIHSIPRLIAYFSQMTLMPGDVIATGSPGGGALSRGPGDASWYLNAGDVIEAEVEDVGVLVNAVVDEPA